MSGCNGMPRVLSVQRPLRRHRRNLGRNLRVNSSTRILERFKEHQRIEYGNELALMVDSDNRWCSKHATLDRFVKRWLAIKPLLLTDLQTCGSIGDHEVDAMKEILLVSESVAQLTMELTAATLVTLASLPAKLFALDSNLQRSKSPYAAVMSTK